MGVSFFRLLRREWPIPDFRINEQIKAETVRLVGAEGNQLGILPRAEALLKAREIEVDLVEVAPHAEPPVCRLLDYGKFKYRQKKKKHTQKHHKSRLKGMKIGMSSDTHDLEFKAERVKEFLKEHDKVEVFMLLRGRQRAHGDLAVEQMTEFAKRFDEVAKVERGPQRAGPGRITMLLTPKS
jgi:translation initiation factor IF-3